MTDNNDMDHLNLQDITLESDIKNDDSGSFNMLSCNSKLGKKDPRVSLIRKAIKDKNVKNIAVVGPYGSGKSSVITSFIDSKITNKKTLFFSIDTLKKYKSNLSNDGDDKNKDTFAKRSNIVYAIYNELLKRNTNSIVLDKYVNNLFNGVKQLVLFFLFLVASLCSCVLGSYYLFPFIGWWCCLVGVAAFSLLQFLYFTVSLRNIKVQNRLSGMDVIAELDKTDSKISFEKIKNHPGLAENIIVKQLSSKKIRYVVFEDLDRLSKDKYDEYIEDIKDFNYLINQSNGFKCKYRRVIFFYAIRDNAFSDSMARVKCFDLIVPVVPFATSANAPDSIMLNSFIKNNVDQNAIVDLSSYLLDQRQVNAATTQFNINKQITYSDDLLTELFALTILNVRFPSVYAQLYENQNFLNALIKDFEANRDLFKSFSIIGPQTPSDADSLKKLRIVCHALSDNDKVDLELFLKTCLIHRYITFNYEALMHSNIENGLAFGDLGYIHKFNAREYHNYYQIMNPLALLQHIKKPETMFAIKDGINIYLLRYIFGSKTKFTGLDICRETAISSLNKMSNDEMSNYINNTNPLDYEGWYELMIKVIPGSIQLYYAATKIKNEDIRFRICLKLFNNYDASNFDANKKLPNEFIEIINSIKFIDLYGQQMLPNQTIKLINSSYFFPKSIVNLKLDNNVINLLSTSLSFEKSFENMCIVYKDFAKQPFTVINSSEKLWNNLIKDKANLIILLGRCNLKDASDTPNSCIAFIDKAVASSNSDILNSKYFDQWEHRLVMAPAATNKYIAALKRGLIDFSNPSDIDVTKTIAPDALIACIKEYVAYFSTIHFNASTSWLLVAKLDTETLYKLKDSLTLDDSVNHVSSLGYNRINEIINLLNPEEKNKLLKFIMLNSPSNIVEAYAANTISVNDLKDIKINAAFIDAIFAKETYKLLNTCIEKQNLDVSKQYILQHPQLDYKFMFIGNDNELLKCEDTNLIVEYCKSEKRDFDFVRTLITSLPIEQVSQYKDWRQFLESFDLKKESKDSKYLYFQNNENNNAIIEHFNEIGVVKNVKYLDNNSIIRCTMS